MTLCNTEIIHSSVFGLPVKTVLFAENETRLRTEANMGCHMLMQQNKSNDLCYLTGRVRSFLDARMQIDLRGLSRMDWMNNSGA